MKNKTLAAVIIFLLLAVFTAPACAYNADEYSRDSLEAIGADELSDYLDDETKGYLERLGCEEIEFEKLLDVSPAKLLWLIADMLKKGLDAPLRGMLTATGAVLLVSMCAGFFPDDEKSKSVLTIISGCIIIIAVFTSASDSIRAVASAIEACVNFEKALIPVLATVVTVSGNPTLALTFKGAAFAAAEFISNFSRSFALPLVSASGALGIVGAMLPTLKLSAISEIIRKTMTTLLSSATGLFTGFLALKSILSSSADSVAVKGVKLAANTFIPVVGGAIGEALSSVTGSLSLLKNTVGIYAVVSLFLMTVPVIVSLALWVISMRAACAVSDLLDCRVSSEILKNIAFLFSMLNTILILCLTVFVITAGMIVIIKTGG